MITKRDLKAGIFLPPFHSNDEDPQICFQRDFELIQRLDKLGFHEAWIGEHHSGGFEIYSSPELFIATAAERTKQIKLGTGVISLPYHNPLIAAGRISQLDHQTRGRALFGFGPGMLVSDAMMLGINPDTQRARMGEALDVIIRLLAGEVVTQKTEWFDLREARLNLAPFTQPRPHFAVASTATPNGARLAGKYGLGMLCIAAAAPAGYNALDFNWRVANEMAAERGSSMDPRELRLMAPIHVAETHEQAVREINWGFEKFRQYMYSMRPEGPAAIGMPNEISMENVGELNAEGKASIGTPDDAVALLERFWQKTGGFGTILILAHDWASTEDTNKSFDMFARYVLPKFASRNTSRVDSLSWIRSHREEFTHASKSAMMKVVDKFMAEEAAKKKEPRGGRSPRGRA
jgi:limonene 1,2-monooxygenase